MVITLSGNRTIKFVYDASGAKLEKITNDGINPAVTYDYVNGVEYKNGVLQRIAHPEGEVALQPNGTMGMEYVLRDHLGNARVVFSDSSGTGVVSAASITQINHYYAFGMNMEGNWNGASGNNKYQYTDKEWNVDLGLNMNDYGARWYDPAVGRFFVKDRFAEKYTYLTPYQYGADNPVKYIDINGDSTIIKLANKQIVIYNSDNGKLFNRDGSGYTGKIDGFLLKSVNDLNKINSKPAGHLALSMFNGKENILVKQSHYQNQTIWTQDKDDRKLARVTIEYLGTSDGGPDINGSLSSMPFIGLAHEFGHGLSFLFQETQIVHNSGRPFDPDNSLIDLRKVSMDEYNAVNWENKIRNEHGLPLREAYSEDGGKLFMPFLKFINNVWFNNITNEEYK